VDSMKKLLIVANTPSENTQALAQATLAGCVHDDFDSVAAKLIDPLAATADDVLSANGIILGTTENFGYMSGALKDFFDRVYYPILEETQGMPYALYVRAGLDGTGTISQSGCWNCLIAAENVNPAKFPSFKSARIPHVALNLAIRTHSGASLG